ncbi:MAG TPA: hypothetical protein DFS52_25525 [Myxococcales bacterium]|jgi:hypothetical protein|nr:hypothetical protein [Myxococcales bacterium]
MTYIADMTHFVDVLVPGNEVPPAARRLAEYLGSIVSAASLAKPEHVLVTGLRCRRRPRRKACQGQIRLRVLQGTSEILWECTRCGDNGIIHNWQGTLWDCSCDRVIIH